MDSLPTTWAMTSRGLSDIAALSKGGGDELAKLKLRQAALQKQAQAGRGAAAAKSTRSQKIGYVPVLGSISHRPEWWANTSSMEIINAIEVMSRDPSVSAIILDVDSPGGSVSGTMEASDAIFAARERVPIIAIANSLAASAAYWIGSAATKLYVTPSGEVGSIGVFAMHLDVSEMNKKLGIKPSYISAGKYKTEGNPNEPLSTEARRSVQDMVDSAHRDFVRQVARNRNSNYAEVRNGYGEGRVLSAKEAVKLGMADGIQSFSGVLNIARNSGSLHARSSTPALRAQRAQLRR